jgi:hypothetical protein
MAKRKYNEARAKANKKYDGKTYKTYGLRLRLEEDREIIESIDSFRRGGRSLREWINDLYERGRG